MTGPISGSKIDPITGGIISSGDVTATTSTQTGSGVTGVSGSVPDSSPMIYSSVLQSLRTMMPNVTSEDFEVLVAQITAKLKDVMGEVQESRANNEMETKRQAIQENQAKIEESKRKLDEAEAKAKSGNIFDILSLAFQALAAAFMTVVGALLVATGVAATAGALLIVSGAMMFLSVANSVCAKCNEGAGLLGSIAKAANGSEDLIMGLDMAFTGAMVIAGIALAVFSGGVSMADTVNNTFRAVTTCVEAGLAVAGAASQVVSSSFNMSATVDRADAKKVQAESQDIQAMMQMLDDLIDQAMALLMQIKDSANAMMNSVTEMLNDTGNTVSNTRFSG